MNPASQTNPTRGSHHPTKVTTPGLQTRPALTSGPAPFLDLSHQGKRFPGRGLPAAYHHQPAGAAHLVRDPHPPGPDHQAPQRPRDSPPAGMAGFRTHPRGLGQKTGARRRLPREPAREPQTGVSSPNSQQEPDKTTTVTCTWYRSARNKVKSKVTISNEAPGRGPSCSFSMHHSSPLPALTGTLAILHPGQPPGAAR